MKTLLHVLALTSIVATTFNCYSQTLTTGLVASYPLDGNANDLISPANNGIATNTTNTSNRFGRANAAFSFNGTAKVELPGANFSLNTYSYSVWVMTPTNPSSGNATAILSFGNSGTLGDQVILLTNNYSVPTQKGFNAVSYSNPSTYPAPPDMAFSGSLPTAGFWHHVVSVRDSASGKLRLYVDGSLILEKTLSSLKAGYAGPVIGVIGARTPGNTLGFNGSIDNVRIYNRVLTNAEVLDLYNQPDDIPTGLSSAGTTSTLKVYPNPANDIIFIENSEYLSSSGHTLTITNMLGQTVYIRPMDQQQIGINVDKLEGAGTYFLVVKDAAGIIVETQKTIIR